MAPEFDVGTAALLQRNARIADEEFQGLSSDVILACERDREIEAELDSDHKEEPLFTLDIESAGPQEPVFDLEVQATCLDPVFELETECASEELLVSVSVEEEVAPEIDGSELLVLELNVD